MFACLTVKSLVKFTVIRASVSTASPDCRYGLNRHCFMPTKPTNHSIATDHKAVPGMLE